MYPPSRFPCCVLLALSWNTMKIQVQISWVGQSTSTHPNCIEARRHVCLFYPHFFECLFVCRVERRKQKRDVEKTHKCTHPNCINAQRSTLGQAMMMVMMIRNDYDGGNDDDEGNDDDDDDDVGGGGKLAIKGRPAPRARSEAFILLHRSLHSLRPSAFLFFFSARPSAFLPIREILLCGFFSQFRVSIFLQHHF